MTDNRQTPAQNQFLEIHNPYLNDDFGTGDSFYYQDVVKQIKDIFDNKPDNKIIVLHGGPGSGKTRALKRIAGSPKMLGKDYIPIYLDSRKYFHLDLTDLSFSLYKDIIETLNTIGYNIPQPDYFEERRKRGNTNTLELLVLTIDNYLHKDEILVLIVDELDLLLENIDIKTISDLIDYFKHYEKTWDDYALVLAGDRKLLTLSGSETINRFLKVSTGIDIEEVLDEDTIRRLIVEPVKDQLTYEEDAITSIIWYSGKNVFFQQLICHFLVKFLNKEKRYHCLASDVHHVIQSIISENIKEFNYYWDHKLSVESKIISSALSDEHVTEKTGSIYVLKGNQLLEDIFGTKLGNEIDKLKQYRYINEMERRSFKRYPIKIPLYGKWLQREHPFLKTVIQNSDTIAHRLNLNALISELEDAPSNKLAPFDKEAALDLAKSWLQLTGRSPGSKPTDRKTRIEYFLGKFFSRLDLEINQHTPLGKNFSIIDVKKLKLGILEEALCVVQDQPDLTEGDISEIESQAVEFAQQAPTKLTLFFHSQKSGEIAKLEQKKYLSLVTIGENDFKRILLSNRPAEISRKIILSKLSLQRISPYKIAGPADTTFYGRADIINKISGTTHTSFAIVGARKIGKSSLLHKIKNNPLPKTTYLYMDLDYEFSNVKTYKTFVKSLQAEIEKAFNIKVDFGKFPFGIDLTKLSKTIQKLSIGGKRIIFIFDEIDGLLEFDKKNNYKLLRIFRTMSQQKHCQFIFSGFKQLYQRKREIDNPLYNFCEEIVLQPLDRKSAEDLITDPLKSIGIHYKNPEDRELILGYTACHPNLLQFFCKNLIEKIDQHTNVDDRRVIFRDDIEELYNTKYEDHIMDQVYMFSSLSAVSQLILIHLVKTREKGETFSENELKKELIFEAVNITKKELNQNLKSLVMRFILMDEGKETYKLALSVFPEILLNRIDEDYIISLRKEILEHAPNPI